MWYKSAKLILAQTREKYLREELKANPEVIDFLLQQPDDFAKRYIAVLIKNPAMSLEELQEQTKLPKKMEFTQNDINLANRFEEPYKTWVFVQLRKSKNLPEFDLFRQRYPWRDVYDWWRTVTPKPEIASFTSEQAKSRSDEWHEQLHSPMKKSDSKQRYYEEKNIVYGPKWENKEWDGWTIQKVTSENDLETEGVLMNHCIGKGPRYYQDVQAGIASIYSLRDPSNKPHVSLEIGDNDDIVQIKANSNLEPNQQYKTMLKEWLSKNQFTMNNDDRDTELIDRYNSRYLNEAIDKVYFSSNDYGIKDSYIDVDTETLYQQIINKLNNYELWQGWMDETAQSLAIIVFTMDKKLLSDLVRDQKEFLKTVKHQSKHSFERPRDSIFIKYEPWSPLLTLEKETDKNNEFLNDSLDSYMQELEENPDFYETKTKKPDRAQFKDEIKYQEALENYYDEISDEFTKDIYKNQLPYAFDSRLHEYIKKFTEEDSEYQVLKQEYPKVSQAVEKIQEKVKEKQNSQRAFDNVV